MKTIVKNLKVNHDEFTGHVILNDIEYDVSGSFSIEFDDQHPLISDITLEVGQFVMSQKLMNDVIDIDELTEQIIGTDDGSWYYEHAGMLAEQRNDMLEDR